jgi:hypothetical protein
MQYIDLESKMGFLFCKCHDEQEIEQHVNKFRILLPNPVHQNKFRVRRSSGVIEDDWFIQTYEQAWRLNQSDRFHVRMQNGSRVKLVFLEELVELNQSFASYLVPFH